MVLSPGGSADRADHNFTVLAGQYRTAYYFGKESPARLGELLKIVNTRVREATSSPIADILLSRLIVGGFQCRGETCGSKRESVDYGSEQREGQTP